MEHRSRASTLFPQLGQSALDEKYAQLGDRFCSAAQPADLHRLIAEIDTHCAEIDTSLAHYASVAAKQHTSDLSGVELTRAKLSGAIANSSELTRVFVAANDLGHTLTAKIKALDQEIGNVDSTLRYVADTQTLKNNVAQTSYAIEKHDWDQAARCIHTIKHQLPPALVSGQFASAVVPSSQIPELPGVVVDQWMQQLTGEFQQLFSDAAQRRSVPEISQYFQLFPLIGQPEVGLNCYARFICSIITETSRTLIGSATGSEHRAGMYANVASSLFESVSMMLSQHTPLIVKNYEAVYPNAVVYVVTKIQREIDAQIGTIADTFYDACRVDKLLADTGLHKFLALKKFVNPDSQGHDDVLDDDVTSVVEIGDVISEFAAIMHHWLLYCKFVAAKYLKDKDSGDSLDCPPLLASSNFNRKLQAKYLPAFETLCTFYLRRSVEKAIAIEELPELEPLLALSKTSSSPDQTPVSSVIEDVTLVFNTVFRDVLDSAQLSTVRSFIAEAAKILQKDLLSGFFNKMLLENSPRYNHFLALILPSADAANTVLPSRTGTPAPESVSGFFKGASSALGNVVGTGSAMVSAATPGATTNSAKSMNFVIYLNTVAAGQEFFQQIVGNYTTKNPAYLKNVFPFGIDEEKANNVIRAEFLEPFVDTTRDMIKQSVLVLFNQNVKNRIAAMVADCFPEVSEENYMLHSSAALNDPETVLKFKQTWDAIIRPYKQTLHKELIYDRLLRLIVVNIASMIEKRLSTVLKKFKINELGALKLDKDLSYIINEVCEDDYDLREKFVRVTQLVLLVGMDNEEYEMSFYNGDEDESGINWILTPLERKQIRRYRV